MNPFAEIITLITKSQVEKECLQFKIHKNYIRPNRGLIVAWDRVCELFKAGINDDAFTLKDNRLASMTTVWEWNKELLGPAPYKTGFEQGGINLSDFNKLYKNEQLDTAQSSGLGVDLGSIVIS